MLNRYRHPLAIAAGKHYRRYHWDHFITLSTKNPESPAYCRREVGALIRRLERLAQRPIQYLWAIEGDPAMGLLYHLHLVVYGTSGLTIEELRSCWRRGYRTTAVSALQRTRAVQARTKGRTPTRSRTSLGDSKVRVYDPSQEGAAYVVKGLRPGFNDWDVSKVLPPLLPMVPTLSVVLPAATPVVITATALPTTAILSTATS